MGTDSHTTMINGLGVLGWGVGGIEAEAVMLGQSISMLLPQVVGYRLHGILGQYVTSTDLVLTITKVVLLQPKLGLLAKMCFFTAFKAIRGSRQICRVFRTGSSSFVHSGQSHDFQYVSGIRCHCWIFSCRRNFSRIFKTNK